MVKLTQEDNCGHSFALCLFSAFLLASGDLTILAFIGSLESEIGQGLFSGPEV